MKRLLSFAICILLLVGLTVPAMATGMKVVFTSNSSFVAGGTVSVDVLATQRSILDDPNATSDYFNAALEANIQFYWFRNDNWYADGTSIKLTDADKGCEFFCRAVLYSDADHTQQCGALDSAKFTVPNTGNPALIPNITTKSLKDGTVGQSYYQRLECTDPDVTYSLFRSNLPDGLYLTQHGEIEGTPTKAGFWYVVIMVTPEAGSEYANTAEFEITIQEEEPHYSMEIMQVPNKITYVSGEKLDMTGLRVRIYTPDGFIDSRDGDKLTYSQEALVTVGEQKIKLTYQDAVVFFIVTVEEAPNEPTAEPTEDATGDIEETDGAITEDTAVISTEGNPQLPTDGTDHGSSGLSINASKIILLIAGVFLSSLTVVAVIVVLVIILIARKRKSRREDVQ